MKILRRYVLRQHILPFVFAFSALTSFELVRQIARRLGDLLGKGLPWTIIAEFFLLTIPFLIAITLSMSVLVAVLYTVSRMTGDHELTAIRAGGVSIGQLVRPLLAAATGVALVSFLFGDQVLPRTNHRLRSLMTSIYQTRPTFSLKEHAINEVKKGRLSLRAARIDQATYQMWDVTLYQLEQDGNRIIYADSGLLEFAPNQVDLHLTLYDGSIHEFDRERPWMFQRTDFTRQLVQIRDVGRGFVRRQTDEFRGDREMGVCQLEGVVLNAQREALVAQRQADVAQTNGLRRLVGLPDLEPDTVSEPLGPSLYCRALAAIGNWIGPNELQAQESPQDSATRELVGQFNEPARRALTTGVLPRQRATEVRVLRDRVKSARVREAVYLVEMHKKYAIPAACIVLVLVGVPLAVRFPRGGVGLVIGAGLAVFSIYYVGLIAGETLANRRIVAPFLAMWASNIVTCCLGLGGMWWIRQAGTVRAGPHRRLGSRIRQLLRV